MKFRWPIAFTFMLSGMCFAHGIEVLQKEDPYWWLWFFGAIAVSTLGQFLLTSFETETADATIQAVKAIQANREKNE